MARLKKEKINLTRVHEYRLLGASWFFTWFVSGRLENSKIPDHLGFSRHMKEENKFLGYIDVNNEMFFPAPLQA